MMTELGLFEYVVGAILAIIGWWGKAMHEAIRDLQTADKSVVDRVSKIEVLVAGKYVTRTEMDTLTHRLFEKLDRIEENVSKKADK